MQPAQRLSTPLFLQSSTTQLGTDCSCGSCSPKYALGPIEGCAAGNSAFTMLLVLRRSAASGSTGCRALIFSDSGPRFPGELHVCRRWVQAFAGHGDVARQGRGLRQLRFPAEPCSQFRATGLRELLVEGHYRMRCWQGRSTASGLTLSMPPMPVQLSAQEQLSARLTRMDPVGQSASFC